MHITYGCIRRGWLDLDWLPLFDMLFPNSTSVLLREDCMNTCISCIQRSRRATEVRRLYGRLLRERTTSVYLAVSPSAPPLGGVGVGGGDRGGGTVR
jgi:hypothetical protein